jgi:hypothetical protein
MRLQVIDRRLGQCANVLRAATDAQRPQIWATVDELLDERLTITGPPAVPPVLPPAKPKVAATRTTTCQGCGTTQPVRWVPPSFSGATGVWVLECRTCDFTVCHAPGCGATIPERKSKRCPNGHEIHF